MPVIAARAPGLMNEENPAPRIGHYRVLRPLGKGGMGIAYVAEDERLGRLVALKLLQSSDATARARLVREARIAAGITHPRICQVFELGEWNHEPFIVMELLDGESLAERLVRGALAPGEAISTALSIVEALVVLHGRGVVHRDLKPSNIFLTSTGVKVLDFGLARPIAAAETDTLTALSVAGAIVGTPQYAAPEQLAGGVVDARTDVFALGVILYEMLAGRPPFTSPTLAAQIHAVLYDTAPVLTGSPAIAAADRVLHRALAKQPSERYPTADGFGDALRTVRPLVGDGEVVEARPLLRLAVLPFRLLKPDPAVDYLGLSLADALVSSLLGLESLVVRSTLKSARYANTLPDLNVLATDLAVDVVLTGSILRASERVRVSAELVSVPAGDVWWSQTTHVPVDEVLDLHDDLARRVVESLPLTAQDRARTPTNRAASAKAFDLYLHGMQLRSDASRWRQAHAYFTGCLEVDDAFAPAWAELGRLDRLLSKYEDLAKRTSAESALLRALALDPENGAAQYYYAQLEIDVGRLDAALARLLERVRRRRAEPHVYAALVHACRYAGLLEESVAAHQLAHRLDPTVATSVHHTYYLRGEFDRALDQARYSNDPLEMRILGAMGRKDEAIAAAHREELRYASVPVLHAFAAAGRAALEGRMDDAVAALAPFETFGSTDGEALFYVAGVYAMLGRQDTALTTLGRAVDAGFVCVPAFERDVYLAPLKDSQGWRALMDRLALAYQQVVAEFIRVDGPALLGTDAVR
jgi:serine/threonine protein kinase/tetratricopeptide (TPR) repeat protein